MDFWFWILLMAFGGGINPNTPPIVTPPGVIDRRGLTSPAVPNTKPTLDSPVTGVKAKPVLSPEAGLFGGIAPPSRTGTEKRASLEGDARRAETFHPATRIAGPLVLSQQDIGGTPVYPLPAEAAEVFAAMAKGLPLR